MGKENFMGLKEFLFKQRGDTTPDTVDNKDIAALLFLGICAIFIAGLNIFIISALLIGLLVKILRIEYERRYGYSVGRRIVS
ncbi:hypothetical protein A2924_00475 [Candidatus Giovannonibacteria bacterium RIFCSPLOWO2_01_FULL_44_16]|uniref:Uncharacterized protein n=1 Tax=Candidatus Giovannonibacteria bacterium RIFCSPLOWO2_01_FULL_44_16 TaxID=1798348 RepID=A0A1F5X2L2_9BACT|nr:MAG: hypothetical protein A2924_00475 [Candidatus Giovannonibacteria bacterium RIFCSPLOWO2_01_FULL_44_16]